MEPPRFILIKLIPFLGEFMTANDMLKYFGIVFWLAYFARTAAKHLRSEMT